MLEKGREMGAHQLSGAILDPRGLRELVPDFEKTAPLDTPVTSDGVYFLSESRGGSSRSRRRRSRTTATASCR